MTSLAPAVPQLLLPGQAAAPEGPVDIAPMYLMHRAFRRDLDAFLRTVPAIPPSDAARWARLARRFAFFGSVLHKHHRGEDVALWPLLAEGLIAGLLGVAGWEGARKWLPYQAGFTMAVPEPDVDSLGRVGGGLWFFTCVLAITAFALWSAKRRDA